ncbi:FeoB-associated Cys-rich membrane protein [Listeria monocytogenes]|nr:FeoB-associated Cys-rich membrane protein [Listeria monocytogenes]EIF5040103.1 FeoB-associated Cys-rich membrane protein [Listeria monocytogenes]EKZ4090318.1 FeoB-associated Cys-rich membrane protein [Listeria monocytogenes]
MFFVSIMVNLLLGGAIFGYTIYAIIKFIKRSKQGKCGGCELEKACNCESDEHTNLDYIFK